jgi:uncharacterized protein DUF429
MHLSLGIDLASQNKNTAACVIEWHASTASAHLPVSGPTGESIGWLIKLSREAHWVGIDAPFGWPDAAVKALTAWANGERWPEADKDDLRYRLTDRYVRETTKLSPLSVSSDRIAVAAWRCARLLDALRPNGRPVDRTGQDGIFEVYPGAALTCWGLNRAGYKTSGNTTSKQRQRRARIELIGELERIASWLDLSTAQEACIEGDDALDALIAALVARAAGLGHTIPPPCCGEAHECDRRTAREGWIHLPKKGTLARLA